MTDEVAELTIAKLLFLADADAQAPIKLFINCPGGVLPAGMAIFDVMTEMQDLIHTHCYGFAGGFATILMAHGQRKHRSAAPDARFALANASAIDSANADVMELNRCQMLVIDKLSSDTRRSRLDIGRDMNEGIQLDASGAIVYGLIDRIVQTEELAGHGL